MTLSPHDLRHTFGHRWLVKGGDIYTLSKILGHASVAVTEKHYAKLLRENIADKMKAVMEPLRELRVVKGGKP
jgi:integrase/recombinase XerD